MSVFENVKYGVTNACGRNTTFGGVNCDSKFPAWSELL
jgi:hypothetical protein